MSDSVAASSEARSPSRHASATAAWHDLDVRLAAAGIDDDADDAFATWRRLRAVVGRRATVVDLYALVARQRGLAASDLPLPERRQLAEQAFAVMYPGFETTPGSDRAPEAVEVVPYDPAWAARFERWRERLATELRDVAVRIEHVGSTAVPGLDAKPVIDIQVSVRDLAREELYVPPMEALNLQLRSRDAEHRFLRPSAWLPRDVHVHVCVVDSAWEREHLLIRDHLRADSQARDEYAALKREAATTWRDDRVGYTEAKTALILDMLDAATK